MATCAQTMLDWDDLRFFLAVSRHGTMSQAARALRVTQPTVGRRIAAFERRLGARLFNRAPSGWVLSNTGRRLVAHAVSMEQEALAAETIASGRDEGLRGKVRITASDWIIQSVLGPAVAPLLGEHPGLVIDLVADPKRLNLTRREADIAIRPTRFEQPRIVQRQIATVQFGLYASHGYLTRRGLPDFEQEAAGHALVSMGDELTPLVDQEWLPKLAPRAHVAARTNGREAMARMAAAGVGIACLPRVLGDTTSDLRLLNTPGNRPERALWLGVHRDARSVPRVKAVTTFIADAFERLRALLRPDH